MSQVIIILKTTAIIIKKKYLENHPNIEHTKETFQYKHIPSLLYKTTEEDKKLAKEVNAKKATGFEKFHQNFRIQKWLCHKSI